MAPSSEGDYQNDVVSSQTQTEGTTATMTEQSTTSIGTLMSPLPPLPFSSSDPPNDSLHSPPLPTLPFELVTEILYRLPVKFLLQLKCICKSWNSLISDPKFAKKHLRVSTKRHNLILTYRNLSREFTLTAYPLPSIFTGVTAAPLHLEYALIKPNCFNFLAGSCDGILCFAIDQNSALLFNPSIREFNKLPKLKNPLKDLKDGSFSFTTYSFGYDHVTDDYKVVAIFCYESDNAANGVYETLVNVYSLSTNRWRKIQEFPSAAAVLFTVPGSFVSGTVNWLAYPGSIVSLDLGNVSYEYLLQPDYGDVIVMSFTLGVLRDCLCIISHSLTCSDLWIMKEYGNKESWTKLFTAPYMGDVNLNRYNNAKSTLCL